jgi:plasmid stabilization system protein ParE
MALLRHIVDRAEGLDGQPLVGAEVPEYGDPTIREVYEHPYRLVYRVKGDDIQIVAVIHSARRMPTNPPT